MGGYLESSRAAMMFPLLLPQFAMAGFVCFFGIDGVELTQFATDKSSFALSLSATAAVGHFLVAIVCFVAVLRRPDDAGSYLSGGILAAPLALVSIGCGANVMIQAGTVRHFVENNWHMVLQMLPSEFQQLSQDKYINASEDAFNVSVTYRRRAKAIPLRLTRVWCVDVRGLAVHWLVGPRPGPVLPGVLRLQHLCGLLHDP